MVVGKGGGKERREWGVRGPVVFYKPRLGDVKEKIRGRLKMNGEKGRWDRKGGGGRGGRGYKVARGKKGGGVLGVDTK